MDRRCRYESEEIEKNGSGREIWRHMDIRETELPGIGKKFQADTRSGERVVVVIHDDGRREVFQFDSRDPDEATSSFSLEDDEARQLAGILGGMAYTPRALEKVEVAFDELVIEWYRVEEGSEVAGRTIGELEVRESYGATVVAMVGAEERRINPGPEVRIESGSTLVVAGEREQVSRFRDVLSPGRG